MKSGIYKYTNKSNGKVYIGSAVNLIKRHWEHLNYPAKSAKLLQKAFNKYGKDNFIYDVLEHCPKHLLYKIEQGWMNWYKCYERDKGYNLSKIAEGSRNGCTKEQALKAVITKRNKGFNKETYPMLSFSKLGAKNPMFGRNGINSPSSKEVYCFNKNGILINKFNSLVEAGNILNIGKIKMNRKSYKGYLFSYTNTPTIFKNNKLREVGLYKDNKIVYSFNTMKEASLYLNVHPSTINKAIKDNFLCKGFKIKYANGKI